MPKAQQAEYLAAFYYARDYLKTFDYQAELAYYNRLERGECENTHWADATKNFCPRLFTRQTPDGRANSYRKLAAFVFRRVHFDHVPTAALKFWLDKVIVDLEETTDVATVGLATEKVDRIRFTSKQPTGLPEFKIYDSVGLDEPIEYSPCKFYKPDGQWHWYPRVGQPNDKYWQVPVTELERCGYKPLDLDWADVVTSAIEQLKREPATYADWLQQDPSLRVPLLTAYALLQTGNGPIFDRERDLTETFRRQVLPQLYRSPSLLEAVYAWVKPKLLAKFVQVDSENRAAYLDILRHGERYLASFNYAQERAYLARLERGQCKNDHKPEWWDETRDGMRGWAEYWKQDVCVLLFTHQDPNGRTNPYRKLETFIFRRVHTDKVPVVLMQRWVSRFRADLEAVHRTANAQAVPANTP